MKILAPLLTVALFAAAGAARAASCEPTLFPQSLDALAFARVTAPKAQLFHDPQACQRPTGLCPSKAYLVAGDAVVTAQTQDGKICVAFMSPRRMTIGWVDAKALTSAPAPPSGAWEGHWTRPLGDAHGEISRRGRALHASLSASAEGGQPGNVRTGGGDGDLLVNGERAQMTAESISGCRIMLRRLGPFLAVNDGANDDANSPCGGIGVSMNGIYRRGDR